MTAEGATPQHPMPDLAAGSVPRSGYPSGSPEFRRVVIALFFAGLSTFVLVYNMQALLPQLSVEFGVSYAVSTLSLSLTALGLGFALLVAGPLSDRVGRTRLIHLSLWASAVVAVACAVAPTWNTLLIFRALQGVTLAGLPAVATAYLREELHSSTHGRAAGIYIGGTALGGMAGRLVAGAVGEVAGWRWALAACAVVAMVSAVVVKLLLPPSRNFVPEPAGGRELVRGFGRAWRDPVLVALYVIGACSIGSLVAVFNTIGFRLERAPFSLGLGAASLVFLVYLVGTVTSPAAGRLADSVGRRAVVPLGCLVAVCGALLTLVSSLPVMVIGLAVLVAGFFTVHGVASGWVPARAYAGGAPTAQAASLYSFSYYLGSSAFGAAAGWAWSGHAWPGVVGLTVALLLVTGGLALALRRTRPLTHAPG